MWDPYDNGLWTHQRGSFLEPVSPPTVDPDQAPLYCVHLSAGWIAVLAGAALQLAQPSTWLAASEADRALALARATDLIAAIGNAELCPVLAFQLTDTCGLQYSIDGGATWLDFTGWDAHFPTCVAENTPRIQMQPGYTFPPIPQITTDGTDYVYSPAFP